MYEANKCSLIGPSWTVADKKVVAHHEAGHAVIARFLGLGVPCVQLTHEINSSALHEGAAWRASQAGLGKYERIAAQEMDIKVALAGPLAQQRYRPLKADEVRRYWRTAWAGDLGNALNNAGMILALQQGREPVIGESVDLSSATRLLDQMKPEVLVLVAKHWLAIERVAAALLDNRFVTQNDLDSLIGHN